jgi:hypothetical protein
MRDDFACFILTNGRPDNVLTVHSLEYAGYTGKWYLVLDTDDPTADRYRARYGADRVLTFEKEDHPPFDLGDNGGTKRVIIYARNATDALARQLGLSCYLQLDDDYTFFGHRYQIDDGPLLGKQARYLDDVFDAFLAFLDETGALTVALSQGGDHFGGAAGAVWKSGLRRKAMNSFFVRTGRPVPFVGRINEDVNTYVTLGMRGEQLWTVADFYLVQSPTQGTPGGMSGTYLDTGTYLKSFYSVMFCPSAVSVAAMGSVAPRIHHRVDWAHCVPKVLPERYRRSA